MVHWPATLNTVVTLVAGGALAMAGQALADRRARRRDREARRETFLTQNFTAQQEALMKIQELVEEFSARLIAQYRREHEGPLPLSMKDIIPAVEGQASDTERMVALVKQLKEPISEDERVAALREDAQLMDAMNRRNGGKSSEVL